MKKLKITYFMLGISLYSAYAMNSNPYENSTMGFSFTPRKYLKRDFENEDNQAKRSRRDQFGRYHLCDQTSAPVITHPASPMKQLPQRRYACTEVNSTSTATVLTSMAIITLPDSPIDFPYQQKSIPLITDLEDGMVIE